jgi:hypothetical protein
MKLRLDNLLNLWEMEKLWVAPVSKPLVSSQEQPDASPPLALFEPKREIHAKCVWCPSLRGAFTSYGERDLQATWTPPGQKHFPPFMLGAGSSIPYRNELASQLPEAPSDHGKRGWLPTRQQHTAYVGIRSLTFLWEQDHPYRPDFPPDELPFLKPTPHASWCNTQYRCGLLNGEYHHGRM